MQRAHRAAATVIFGQDLVIERTLVTILSGGHALLIGVRPRQDAAGRHARQGAGARGQAHPVHARPHAVRHHRRGGARGPARPAPLVPLHQGADLHPAPDGRRDQPRQPQDAVGAVAGDAGAPRHGRRRPPRRAGALPRARDPEPARAGGHLSAAGGAARPLPLADRRELSRSRRRAAHALRHHRHRGAPARSDPHRRRADEHPAPRAPDPRARQGRRGDPAAGALGAARHRRQR